MSRAEKEDGGRVRFVPPGEGRSIWVFGGLVTFYARGEETGGAFTLLEEKTEPETGAMPHLHHEEDQAFYMLAGEHEFVCDGERLEAKEDSYVYVPRGVVHSFMNIGTTPGRVLVLSTPAGGTESFFDEVGTPAEKRSSPPPGSGPPALEEYREIARRHGADIDTLALLRQMSDAGAGQEE